MPRSKGIMPMLLHHIMPRKNRSTGIRKMQGKAAAVMAEWRAHQRYRNSDAFCREIMDGVQPASPCEYGGTRLYQVKRQQLYWKFIQMRTAGVTNHSAIARTLNVSRPTVMDWERRMMADHQFYGMRYEPRFGQGIKNPF